MCCNKNYQHKFDIKLKGRFFNTYKFSIQYLEKIHQLDNDLPFLTERIKIEKFEKLVANLHDKTEFVMHIRTLKEALNERLV